MPLKRGKSKKVVEENTAELIRSGRPADQAYAIANSEARRTGKRKQQRPSRKGTVSE